MKKEEKKKKDEEGGGQATRYNYESLAWGIQASY